MPTKNPTPDQTTHLLTDFQQVMNRLSPQNPLPKGIGDGFLSPKNLQYF
jgi:hypothetical protein